VAHRLVERARPRGQPGHAEPGALEVALGQAAEAFIVLDEQDLDRWVGEHRLATVATRGAPTGRDYISKHSPNAGQTRSRQGSGAMRSATFVVIFAGLAGATRARAQPAPAPPAPDAAPSPDDAELAHEAEQQAEREQAGETIEIRGDPPPAAPGAVTMDRSDAERVPGTGGDLVRTLTALPGVLNQPTPVSTSGIVIRGSAPQDSKILIDGFEVPLLYHAIGQRAILPVEAIDALDYIPGGFDVSYGRAGSGIVALTTRPGSDQRSEQVEVSVLDGGALVQGSAGDHTHYMFAARRSTIDLILPHVIPSSVDLSLTTVPQYYDVQARVDYDATPHWTLTFSSIGSLDALEIFADKNEDPDKRFYDRTEFLRLTAQAHWHSGAWSALLALSEMPESTDAERGEVQHDEITRLETTARGELTWGARAAAGLIDLTWRTGGEADISRYHLNLAEPTPPHDGLKLPRGAQDPNDISEQFDATVWTPDFGAWSMLTAGLGPRVHLTAGLRVDAFERSDDVAVQPRGQLEIKLADKTTARFAAGAYRRPAEYQDELLYGYLRPERDTQLIAGVEHEPHEGLRVQTSLYYTDRTHLITSDASGVLGNQGRGTTYGAELLATWHDGPWFGWLTYTYSHSTRTAYPGAQDVLFEYDQPHNLNAALSWKHGKWQYGARFELYSGTPYTPVTGAQYDADENFYHPTYGPTNSQRTPLHHQLDLRIDHTWTYSWGTLTGFIDVQNVYLNDTVTSYSYSYDYSQRYSFAGLPILPTIGVRGVL
jgi:hypothetical protein